jgi:hypothetical protein
VPGEAVRGDRRMGEKAMRITVVGAALVVAGVIVVGFVIHALHKTSKGGSGQSGDQVPKSRLSGNAQSPGSLWGMKAPNTVKGTGI